MYSAADIWQKLLLLIKENGSMTETTINTWLSDAQPLSFSDTELALLSPTRFKRDIIANRYLPVIKTALYDLFSAEIDVRIFTPEDLSGSAAAPPQNGTPIPFSDSEDYTFDRFIVGSSNKFAHAAAMAVADAPAQTYNPLFLYGDSGLGKTHLLYAIAHTVRKNHPDYRIIYIKGDDFTNGLIQAIREGRTPEFREKYREADVLLMDDVQFIAGRESTQEEFFHTFNTLYESRRQIVLTADRPPKDLLRLEERLRTRFEWGLLADIQPPDFETRLAIIQNKALRLGLDLPSSVSEYIAENITSNIRQIEGTVKKILAYRELMNQDVSVSTVTRAVQDIFKDQSYLLPSPELIINEVSHFYDIPVEDLRGQGRTRDVVMARHMAMYLIRRITSLSLSEVGREFENRDHTTVMNSISRIEKLLKTDPKIAEIVRDITANINAHNY